MISHKADRLLKYSNNKIRMLAEALFRLSSHRSIIICVWNDNIWELAY